MSQDTLSPVLRKVVEGYGDFLQQIDEGSASPIDLAVMKIAQWEPNFERNPDSELVEKGTEAWARSHNIWKEGYSEHTNTMGGYLHPETINVQTLAAIDKTYLILFYIDDTISNELQKDLPDDVRNEGKVMMGELFRLLKQRKQLGSVPESRFGLVNATKDLLQDLADLSDPEWLERFMFALEEHLVDTVQDQNEAVIGEQFTRESYIERRNDISGMFVTTWYMEFASGEYLPRTELPENVHAMCQRLEYLCAIIGGIANDFFSFEKEVIDHLDEFNLIPVAMMENPDMGFLEAVNDCLTYLNNASDEFMEISEKLRLEVPNLPAEQAKAVSEYLKQTKFVALASWFWELDTDRYQRPNSMFLQTYIAWRQAQGHTGKLRSGEPLKQNPAA